MGNSHTPLTDYQLVRTYRKEQWIKQNYDHNGEQWRSKFTHQLVRIYPLCQIPSIQDMHRYQLRSTHQYIIKVYNIAIDQYTSVCTSNQNALLLVEHIPLKLIDLRFLDLEESLTVLHSAFRGFHTIQSLFQLVEPDEQLIGFNEQGKTKVWLNRQLNRNYAARQNKTLDLNQFNRVIKIVEMVSKKTNDSKLFQTLKHEICQNSVNYFEASIIVEQFAFKEQLSLKRYVRTDLLTRQSKPETHRRNLTMSTFFPTESSNLNTARKSDIYIPTNQLHKIKSWDRLPMQANLGSRLIMGGSPPNTIASKSIPKITFNSQSINEKQIVLQNNQPKITFSSPKAQQRISFLSTTSSMFSSPVKIAEPESVQQVAIQNKLLQTLNKEQPNQKSQQIIRKQQQKPAQKQKKEQKPEMTKQQKVNSEYINQLNAVQNSNQLQNLNDRFVADNSPILNLQISHKKHSIIDECQKYLQESKINEQIKQQQAHQPLPIVQNSSDVQNSGMFRQIVDQQHLQMSPQIPLHIQQDYIVEVNNLQPAITLQLQSQDKQIPIHFQSFAVCKVMFNQNISFAPKLMLQNIEEKGIAETSKSVDFQEKEKQENNSEVQSQLCQSNQYIQQPPKKSFRLVQSQQRVQSKQSQALAQQQPFKSSENSKIIAQNRFSLELQQQFSAIGRQEKPFYQEYTPVESKFDVMIKRDSFVDRDKQPSEHSNRLSAFGNVEDDDCYERNIKNKLKEMFPSEDLRINRISSEYQTNTKRMNHDSPREPKPQTKLNKISNIHEGVEEDFLDINNLQRTLQMRCSKKEKVHKKSDDFDVDKLEQKLMKFSSSKGQISKVSQNSNNQSKTTFHKPKVPSKLSQFSAQNNQINVQNLQRQFNSPKSPKNFDENQYNFRLQDDFKSTNFRPSYQYQSSTSRYDTYKFQKEFGDRTTNKFSSYKQYSNINSFKTQPYNEGFSSYIYQKPKDIFEKYASNSYNQRYTDILPPYSSIKKNQDALLEERYQKYVKQGKQKKTLAKQKSADSFAKTYQGFKQPSPSQTKRISYDNLRQFLLS